MELDLALAVLAFVLAVVAFTFSILRWRKKRRG